METFESILKRRSIRKFKTDAVSIEILEKIIKAGMYAPSARNQQPWHFILITDRKMLNDLSEIHPYAKMLQQVPAAILVCSDSSLEQSEGYWVQDCSAATQNILLAAYASGLGSVWLGMHPREERINGIKKYLKLPENIKPLSLIALGYADEEKQTPDRFLKERIHLNKW